MNDFVFFLVQQRNEPVSDGDEEGGTGHDRTHRFLHTHTQLASPGGRPCAEVSALEQGATGAAAATRSQSVLGR